LARARIWLGCSLIVACGGPVTTPDPTGDTDTVPESVDTGTPPVPTSDTAPPDPCDACLPEQVCDAEACVDPAVLVYMNFDAEGIFSFDENDADAALNEQASDASLVGILAGYGPGPRRAELLEVVTADFADYAPTASIAGANGIHVVTERPTARTDYHMVVLTPNPPITGQIGLGSPTNCGNAEKNEIFFAFFSANDGYSSQFQGNVVSGGIGNLLGLASVLDGADLMAANFSFDFDLAAKDECLALSGKQDFCADFNADFCPEGQQNTHAVLRSHAGQGE